MAAVAKNLAALHQGKLGGAAADIHVENDSVLLARQGHRAGTVGRQGGLQMVACRGADQAAAGLGKAIGDGLGVVRLERLAGQDDRAAVHLVTAQAGLLVSLPDEDAERVGVDGAVGPIGGQ